MAAPTGHPVPQPRGIHIDPYAKYRMALIRGPKSLFKLGSQQAPEGAARHFWVGVRFWRTPVFCLPRLSTESGWSPRAGQFKVGRVFMSPIAVDRARPLIERKLIPYLYELIHDQASCLVSHFRALTGKAAPTCAQTATYRLCSPIGGTVFALATNSSDLMNETWRTWG
jgi:hypothetical protein